MTTAHYHSPKDAGKFKNEYILFFGDNENPEILFHTLIPEEAYKKAEEIYKSEKKTPIIERVVDKDYCSVL